MKHRRVPLLAGSCHRAQGSHEDLGLSEPIPRALDHLAGATPRVRALTPRDDRGLWEETPRRDNSPDSGSQLELVLDQEVRQVVGQRWIRAVIRTAVKPYQDPIVASSQCEVRAALAAMKRHIHARQATRAQATLR